MNCNNPAQLSSLLGSLFPPGVTAAELRTAGEPALLFPEEARHLGRAVPKRAREFAAGRLCARRALVEAGARVAPLPVNGDRRPQWPDGFTGSITHSSGFCGAAVASCSRFRAIGLDAEVVEDVPAEIWPELCTRAEAQWLARLPPGERVSSAALLFSAKEAYYKCQYGVTGEWLEFQDLALDIEASELWAGRFSIRVLKNPKLFEDAGVPSAGRYRFDDRFVYCGVACPVR